MPPKYLFAPNGQSGKKSSCFKFKCSLAGLKVFWDVGKQVLWMGTEKRNLRGPFFYNKDFVLDLILVCPAGISMTFIVLLWSVDQPLSCV